MNRATLLDDHRRFSHATLLALVALGCLLSGPLLVSGRSGAVPGLWMGITIAGTDVVLLSRGVTRFSRLTDGYSAPVKGMTGGLMSRFVAIGLVLGLAMAARTLNPIAVVCGFLLLPAALLTVGCVAIRRSSGDGSAAGRRQLAR